MVKVLNPQQEGSLVSIWRAVGPPCVMARVRSQELVTGIVEGAGERRAPAEMHRATCVSVNLPVATLKTVKGNR